MISSGKTFANILLNAVPKLMPPIGYSSGTINGTRNATAMLMRMV